MWANVLVLSLAAGATQTASVTVGATDDWWTQFGASASLESYVGIGTFVPNRTSDNPYYASWLTITPKYDLTEDIQLNLALSLSYEWTYFVTPCHAASGPRAAGAAAENCSDTGDRLGRRGDIGDIPIGVSHGKLFEAGPFNLSGAARIELPTSRASRATGNVFTLGARTTGKVDFEPGYASLSTSVSKYFPTAEANVLNEAEVVANSDGSIPAARCASFRTANCLLLSGFVASWMFDATVTAGADIPWVDGLSASISLGYMYSRRHGRDADEFTSGIVDSNGERVVTSVNHGDSTTGTIDVSYDVDDHISLSLGLFSLQPAKTADGRGLRFPFYDFVSPAQNFTAWYLSGSYSL